MEELNLRLLRFTSEGVETTQILVLCLSGWGLTGHKSHHGLLSKETIQNIFSNQTTLFIYLFFNCVPLSIRLHLHY